jgi:hypothetical protein
VEQTQIPFETGLDVTRRAGRAAHDAIVMEWAADVARRDARIAELEAELDRRAGDDG